MASCKSASDVRRKIITENEYQNLEFNPQYYLYHASEDSSTLFFNIDAAEVLYTRSNPENPFQANLEIDVFIYENLANELALVDTINFKQSYTNQGNGNNAINGKIALPLAGSKNYFLEINFIDINKNNGRGYELWTPKSSLDDPMNFLVVDDSTNLPIYEFQKIGAGSVSIFNERNTEAPLEVYEIDLSELKFPPPPFASRQVFLPDLPEIPVETTYFEENFAYFITTDPARKKGMTISVRNPFFPEVKTFEQMVLPTRYITTKSEYEELTSGIKTKESLDDFWIKCGGSTERGKQLIRVYYNRIALANRYFSTINPGWKTDRGAIYVIYGTPTQVQKRNNYETWTYGDITNPNSLSFTFVKTDNIYSNNHYELQRNSGYRIHWQRAVTNWINGRVYERK